MNIHQLVDKEALQQVDYLHWLAKLVTDEYLAGLHTSLRPAWGVEFSQYKEYQPGDDLRMIDWKLLARRDKFYLKQAQQESMLSVRFVIDASNSMTLEHQKLSKLDFAKIIAATLAYIAAQQGDLLQLQLVNESQDGLQQGSQYLELIDFLYRITQINSLGKWSKQSKAIPLANQAHRELVVMLTDHYEEQSEILESVKISHSKNKQWIIAHLMHNFELQLNFPVDAELEDLESGERMMLGGTGVKRHMQQAVDKHLNDLRTVYQKIGVDYLLLNTAQPIHQIITHFIRKRELMI